MTNIEFEAVSDTCITAKGQKWGWIDLCRILEKTKKTFIGEGIWRWISRSISTNIESIFLSVQHCRRTNWLLFIFSGILYTTGITKLDLRSSFPQGLFSCLNPDLSMFWIAWLNFLAHNLFCSAPCTTLFLSSTIQDYQKTLIRQVTKVFSNIQHGAQQLINTF